MDLPQQLLQTVIALAKRAGAATLPFRKAGVVSEAKGDGSPVTAADRAAHRIIWDGLTGLLPGVPIVSEEMEDLEDALASLKETERYWLVDPLDGTKEFIAGRDDYTVNIALIDQGCPVLGVVVVPPTKVSYWAARGAGAWRRQPGSEESLRLQVADPHAGPLRVAVSRSHGDAATARFLAALPESVALPLGSSIKLCAVAEGSVHLCPRFGPTSIWDIAAAHCVVVEAGGRVSPMSDLKALCRYFPNQVLNPPFVAYGGPPQRWETCLSG